MEQSVESVREFLQRVPRRSAGQKFHFLDVNKRSLGHISQNMKFSPYKFQMAHKLFLLLEVSLL